MVKNRKQTIIFLSWTAVLLWMLLIFNLSAQVADQSDKLSKGIVSAIVEMVERVAHGYDIDTNVFNHLVRKFAHFFTYLMLGALVTNALRQSGVQGLRLSILALGICSLYAVSDEVHQLFVPGRGGQAIDILINSAGATIGIGVYFLIIKTTSVNSKGVINGVNYKTNT